MEYRYDIHQFVWNKDDNSFFAEAYFLDCLLPDGTFHREAFPNQKQQFYIDNSKTGGFRRFRFVKEIKSDIGGFNCTEWIFESEDGIECRISID